MPEHAAPAARTPFAKIDGSAAARFDMHKNLPNGTLVGDSADIFHLANDIAKNKIDVGKKIAIRYSIVSDSAASDIQRVTGLDVSGYKHTVDSFGIRHAFKQHGNDKTESKRGQMAITAEDIARIPDVVSHFDSIESAGQDATGNPLIRYTKNVGGTIFHVEEIRQKRMELVTKTLWKTRNNADMPVETSHQLTPEATKGNHPQSGINVNDAHNEVNTIAPDTGMMDALAHLGDVLSDVFGSKLNMTGAKYGAADVLPALSKVVELMVRNGARSLKNAVFNASKAMATIPAIGPHIHKITARQWKAAYNAIAQTYEGTDSEAHVSATPADDILNIVKGQVAERRAVAIPAPSLKKAVFSYGLPSEQSGQTAKLSVEDIRSIIAPFSTLFEKIGDVIHLVPSPEVVFPGIAGGVSNSFGVVVDGRVFLFTDNLHSERDVVRTLWHELFHYGLRKFVTPEQYAHDMASLYKSDPMVRQFADEWMNGADANDRRADGASDDVLRALSVEEGLATFSEMYLTGLYDGHNPKLRASVRRVLNWMADIADRLKLVSAAKYLRSLTISEGAKYLQDIFAGLKAGRAAVEGNIHETVSQQAAKGTAFGNALGSNLAGRLPGAGKYLGGTRSHGAVLTATDGVAYGFAGEGVATIRSGPLGYQAGSVGGVKFGPLDGVNTVADTLVPRVDVTNRFSRTPYADGSIDLQYLNPETGNHGLVVSVDKNGLLGFEIRAQGDVATHGSGTDMFVSAMQRLEQEGVQVNAIRGTWYTNSDSVNTAQYLSNLSKGMTPEQAAANTWTGNMASKYGFTVVGTPKTSTYSDAIYTIFRKPQ